MNTVMARKRRRKDKHPRQKLLGGLDSATSVSTVPTDAVQEAPIEVVTATASGAVLYVDSGSKKIYYYLTKDAVPKGQDARNQELSRGSCPTCRCGYAYMKTRIAVCDECQADRLAVKAQQYESAGINLGWGFSEHTRDYERERRNARPTSRLQQDAKEV